MRVAVLIFGQFRHFQEILSTNIQEIKKTFPDASLDFFILSNRLPSGNYTEENEQKVKDILGKNGTIRIFRFWEDLVEYHAYDASILDYYTKLVDSNLYRMQALHHNIRWTANLWHRVHLLWKFFEESGYTSYDYCVFARIFDFQIRLLRPVLMEQDPATTFFIGSDALFIASPPLMKQCLLLGTRAENFQYFTWTPAFKDAFMDINGYVAIIEQTLSPEAQIFKWVYDTIPKYKNIRWDYDFEDSVSNETANFFIQQYNYREVYRQ